MQHPPSQERLASIWIHFCQRIRVLQRHPLSSGEDMRRIGRTRFDSNCNPGSSPSEKGGVRIVTSSRISEPGTLRRLAVICVRIADREVVHFFDFSFREARARAGSCSRFLWASAADSRNDVRSAFDEAALRPHEEMCGGQIRPALVKTWIFMSVVCILIQAELLIGGTRRVICSMLVSIPLPREAGVHALLPSFPFRVPITIMSVVHAILIGFFVILSIMPACSHAACSVRLACKSLIRLD